MAALNKNDCLNLLRKLWNDSRGGFMPVKLDVAAKNLRSFDKGDIVSIVPDGMDCSDDPENFI